MAQRPHRFGLIFHWLYTLASSFSTSFTDELIAGKITGVKLWILLCMIAMAFPAGADYHSVRGRLPAVVSDGIIEGEWLPFGKDARSQDMKVFGGGWSGDAHLLWHGEPGHAMETQFSVKRGGRYSLSLKMTKAVDYGVFTIRVNGKELRKGVDLFGHKVEPTELIKLGEMELAAGEQKLRCELTGKNPRAKAFQHNRYLLGIDYLKVMELDPPPEPEKVLPPAVDTPAALHTATFEFLQPLLAEHCYRCHGEKGKIKGKVDLLRLKSKDDFLAQPELLRQLNDVLEFREMPPEDETQPDEKEYSKLVSLFSGYLGEHLQKEQSLPPIVMRRMNRYEYNNAVRDLLQLKGDIYPLPEKTIRAYRAYYDPASGSLPDSIHLGNRALGKNQIEQPLLTGVVPFAIDLQSEHGFNNRGDELGFSPILMESFLNLSRSVVESPEFDRYSARTGTLFRAGSDLAKWSATARERLAPFLERAFRKPIESETLERYARLFDREAERGDFSAAMKTTVAAILASPRFLYLLERKQDEAKPLAPYELAGRLSFFLWSSIPDEQLLAAARDGTLADQEIYSMQVARMLLDRRSKSLSENFARQWLRLDRLITAVPDFERFEPYYARIGCEQWKLGLQTMVEPLLLFESIMVEDRSIMLLVDSNYSYRTGDMSSWYAPGVPFRGKANPNRFSTMGVVYQRVPVNNRREGGVITCAATLTMNSSPLRTTPITRGAWVAGVIFNKPPPPPPDNIPEIESDDAKIEASGQTLRQRLIAHQVNQSCVACHQKIDPLGFALENFDAVGRWRDKYPSGLPIDSSGQLFGREKFDDAVGLKDAILANPKWFMRAFSEHLLSYALGRELELADKPAVDDILREVLDARGQFSVVVGAIAKSYPFLHRSNALESE